MKTVSALLLGMACLAPGGASRSALADAPAVSSPSPSALATPSPSPIVSVQTRRHVLRVFSGQGGQPRFAVEDRQGRVLAKDLDVQLLARRWPGLHKTWKIGSATSTATVYAGP